MPNSRVSKQKNHISQLQSKVVHKFSLKSEKSPLISKLTDQTKDQDIKKILIHPIHKNNLRSFSSNIFQKAHFYSSNKINLPCQIKVESVFDKNLISKNSKILTQRQKRNKNSAHKLRFICQNQNSHSKNMKQRNKSSMKKRSKSQIYHTVEYKIPGYTEIKNQQQDGTLTKLILQKPAESSISIKNDDSSLNIFQQVKIYSFLNGIKND